MENQKEFVISGKFNLNDFLLMMCLLWFNGGIVMAIPFYGAVMNFIIFSLAFFLLLLQFPWFINKLYGYGIFYGVVFLLSFSFSSLLVYNTISSDMWDMLYALMILISYVYFSHRPIRIQKTVAYVVLADMILMNIYSCYLLEINPNIARLYASGSENVISEGVNTFLLAGFWYIYAAVPIFVYICLKRSDIKLLPKKYSFLIVLYLISTILIIIKSAYSTAILLLLLFSLCAFLMDYKQVSLSVVKILIVAVIGFFAATYVLQLFIDIFFEDSIVANRFEAVIKMFQGESIKGTDLYTRLAYFRYSFRQWVGNPFFGIYENTSAVLGNHTEWIDMLAKYGFLRYIFYIVFLVLSLKKIYSKMEVSQKVVLFLCVILMGFLNPIMSENMYLALYCVIPFIFAKEEQEYMPEEYKNFMHSNVH